ncbi:hypothetical protein H112_07152 [Trichophyton rubrum D6]|uniref:Uncharacterized protein n=1 Tax=Trichophyton rubrum CBS 288.86 TaxID=1215330 RepID=A0A022VTK7_TRIRU|nr:hypothetical protein H100_07177 [Trichophyton rubrum MR850]EZF38655.1 hypothetical protein H102_07137 [Trichophyton rubrum CBS 100081]EZF49279.1 hypothetical protein H103_07160 [Trichophyton rubrum CBS 288.86]EZF59907.1 hypothetical protein H104_07114 [Trichophyton rubrum CBS 289.86]EZF81168.1 hypothetical protein H110_07160 [Trichophyton rubrum MR1448]EZF91716.1 hypothetical protein H113_07213 [Trichophyton rubrum MR1459]EZG13441.1 hypothetical protein H107_07320 [Trichophyton rubrum CBS 
MPARSRGSKNHRYQVCEDRLQMLDESSTDAGLETAEKADVTEREAERAKVTAKVKAKRERKAEKEDGEEDKKTCIE